MSPEDWARVLCEIGAVEIRTDPETWFTWVSGKRSPIYCDNRVLISLPHVRTRVVDALVAALKAQFPSTQVIAGTATAGIPWAAWVADRLGLPLVYVRASAKEHGHGKRVEGAAIDGARVLVIEDLISYGGSALASAEGVAEARGRVLGVLAIVSYAFPETRRRFEEHGLPWHALVDWDAIVARVNPDPVTARVLLDWRDR